MSGKELESEEVAFREGKREGKAVLNVRKRDHLGKLGEATTNCTYKPATPRIRVSIKISLPIFNRSFPLHSFICHFTHNSTPSWKGKRPFVLKWKDLEGNKEGRTSKRTFAFSKNTLPANTFASPPPAMLSSKTTALKEGKSHPEPSADSNLPKPTAAPPVPSSSSSPTPGEARFRPKWKRAQLCESLQPSQGAWPRPETAGNSCSEINCDWEGRKKREWIHRLLHMSPFWPHKSWFLFSLPTERFFS